MDDEDAYSLIQAFLLWFFDRQHEQHRQQQQQLQLIQQQQEWLANQNQLLRSQLLSQHYLLVEQINSLSAPSRQVSFQGTGPVTNANTNSSLADEEYAVEEETISGQAPAESTPQEEGAVGEPPTDAAFDFQGLPFNITYLGEEANRFNQRFQCFSFVRRYQLRRNFAGLQEMMNLEHRIDHQFTELLQDVVQTAGPNDAISVTIMHRSFTNPIFIFGFKDNFHISRVQTALFRVSQSNSRWLEIDSTPLRFVVSVFQNARGGGKRKRPSSFYDVSSGVVPVKNDDNACGYYAFTLGLLDGLSKKYGHVFGRKQAPLSQLLDDSIVKPSPMKRQSSKFFETMKNNSRISVNLINRTKELFGDFLKTDYLYKQPMSFSILREVSERLNIKTMVVAKCADSSSKIQKPLVLNSKGDISIMLEYIIPDNNEESTHFNYIRNINVYYGTRKFCTQCWIGYKDSHTCEKACLSCNFYQFECEAVEGEWVVCDDCHVEFNSTKCFLGHKSGSIPQCRRSKKCEKCNHVYNAFNNYSEKEHRCDSIQCQRCKLYYTFGSHRCFITPLNLNNLQKQDRKNKIIVAFDIEAALSKDVDHEDTCEHRANLLVCITTCDNCFDENVDEIECSLCGGGIRSFWGETCVSAFTEYVLTLAKSASKQRQQVYIFAHNFSGYDGRFLLRELWRRRIQNLRFIFRGTKIIRITFDNVSFVDTLLLFNLPLSKLPSAFGFDGAKGYFPFLMNDGTEETWNYIGAFPERKLFSPETMNNTKEFDSWHEEERQKYFPFTDKMYNMRDEMLFYCRNDVFILINALMKFRWSIKEVAGIDPITRCFTLASISFEILRSLFLRDTLIGVTPSEGYLTGNDSTVASAYFDLLEESLGRKLQREKVLTVTNKTLKVDAFDAYNNCVYEFIGCYWHGCERCFPEMEERQRSTKQRRDQILARGFRYFPIFECEYEETRRQDAEMERKFRQRLAHYKRVKYANSFRIRDSSFGGRTENFRLGYSCRENESIGYLDFTSLYPYVLKYKMFPGEHPVIITENINYEIEKYFGFVVCHIVPPLKLNFPVLPARMNGKLIFTLCYKCADDQHKRSCVHSEDQRMLKGIWCTIEVDKALEKGYKMIDVFVVYHYEKKFNSPFQGFINMFLKIKQEASGFPSQTIDPDTYIRSYYEKEGIQLEKDKITLNPALRLIAKLLLNSLWGKLGQKTNMPRDELITTREKMKELFSDERREVVDCFLLDEDALLISWIWRNECDIYEGNTSPAVASYVTAYARLKLYTLIEEIESVREGRVLYTDTDSVIYVNREGDPEIQLGAFLGELTDELSGNYKCKAAIFMGPKSYALKLVNESTGEEKEVIKLKGISLKSEARAVINFSDLEKMIDDDNKIMHVPQRVFSAKKDEQIITSRKIEKKLQVTSDKRVTMVAGGSLPYGYAP